MAELPLVLTTRMIIEICNLGVPKDAPARVRMDKEKLRRTFKRLGIKKPKQQQWTVEQLESAWPELVHSMRKRLAQFGGTLPDDFDEAA